MMSERTQQLLEEKMAAEESPARELTVEEAVSLAIRLQQNEQLAEAAMVYQAVFEVAPRHARALHYAGVCAHQQGRADAAIAWIRQSLELAPEQADWHSNLGIVLQGQGRIEEALDAFDRALALDPNHANAHSNRGVLLRAAGRPVEAEAAYRTAIRLDPSHIDAYTNLGILLNGLRRSEEAVACFCKVILLRPKHREARRLLALAHCTLGEVDEAVKIFEEWLAEEPDDPIAQHMLAACTGRDVPARASDRFVAGTFDSFAASFESKLAKLSYRAPRLIQAMVEDAGLPAAKGLDVFDAGCGTGLCGPFLAPYARTLTGVDLSAGMLAQAKEKGVYDPLVQGELTAELQSRPGALDLIVSADTLCYFGELREVIAAAAGALRPGGLLIFTVEHAVGGADTGYRLERHGRYTHDRDYVERLLEAAGLSADIAKAELRMESGVPVAGLVVRARKAPAKGVAHG